MKEYLFHKGCSTALHLEDHNSRPCCYWAQATNKNQEWLCRGVPVCLYWCKHGFVVYKPLQIMTILLQKVSWLRSFWHLWEGPTTFFDGWVELKICRCFACLQCLSVILKGEHVPGRSSQDGQSDTLEKTQIVKERKKSNCHSKKI